MARMLFGRRKPKRKLWSKQVRTEVLRKHGSRCYRCKSPIVASHGWHTDHRIPLARGGKDELANLVPMHLSCNTQKGTKLLPEDERARRQLAWKPMAIGFGAIVLAAAALGSQSSPPQQEVRLAAAVTPELSQLNIYRVVGTGTLGLIVRASPGGSKIGTIYDGNAVLVQGSSNGWIEIAGNGFHGYASGQYLAGPIVGPGPTLASLGP